MTRRFPLHLALAAGALLALAADATRAEDVYGAWDLTLETAEGAKPSWVNLMQQDGAAAAEFVGITGGKNPAQMVQVGDSQVTWTIGGAKYVAKLENDQLVGHVTQNGEQTPFTGRRVTRSVNLTGEWDVEVAFGERTMQRTLTLVQEGDQVRGTYSGQGFPDMELQDATLNDDKLSYSFQVEFGDQGPFTVHHNWDVRGDRMTGEVSMEGAQWQGQVSGVRQRQWAEPIELFNGTDLSNWDFQKVDGENQWKVVDGVMVNEKAGWNIYTKQKFKDYKLSLEVKIPPGGNSGIYLNGRYEVQVADGYGKDVSEGGIGAIYGRAVPTSNPSKPAGEWQKFDIRFVDYWATVTLNGETIVDNVLIEGITGGALDSRESEPGPIMLQGDHGPIEYRNLVLTPVQE